MQADTEQALMMLQAFESIGVRSFDVTMTNTEGEKTGFRKDRQSSDLKSTIGRGLAIAIDRQENVILRPIFKEPQLIQLDDLDAAKVERVAPHAFMTSPGNYQAWVHASGMCGSSGFDKVSRSPFFMACLFSAGSSLSAIIAFTSGEPQSWNCKK